MLLGLVPEVLNSIDVIVLVGKQFRVIDAIVMELSNVQNIMGSETIRVDDRIGLNSILYNRQKC